MAITCEGIYSSGNDTPPGSSLTSYLIREAPRRDSAVYVIGTSEAQDAAALRVAKATYSNSVPKTRGNCSDIVNKVLDAANIPDTMMPHIWPGSAGARALKAGAVTYLLSRGSLFVPGPLKPFEPK